MTTEPEWGPWIEHDGNGPPSIPHRTWVRIQGFNYDGTPHDAEGLHEEWHSKLPGWTWAIHRDPGVGRITRYRIRKPRGMVILQELIENLPAPSKERENA